ncbi:TPA: SDR family NAD(P)-dependent oxidoreductase [Klebsiella pneumoniae]|nr:SDR family NAD(P)-dependent oxidoreductase [Klebsiella pneumoniae]HBQ7865771.1 SDR family NAD(P)-dependent oxidoreductase [Klebsiella pneumoniae]HBQ7873956.1 SDR family NAD(P)-dependent oxidoreductase [Klebsiella pneumoniae]HBQ7883611.1 SDR family NAD(P)-dependent oxidoreductase [Klebsiella pneumoniae]HBQ7890900.1 SDR family NAD(P)-dependent oxidoreductase [Klebsiella pneumoniae]
MASTQWISLNRKTIIVTGGSSGIGEKIAQGLMQNNAQVVVADLQIPAQEQRIDGVDYQLCDITDRDAVRGLMQGVIQRYGRIDGLVNNAAVNRARLLVDFYGKAPGYELSDEDFEFMVSINQKGTFICSQESARQMIRQKAGVIINILSEAGIEGSGGQSCYAATKAAVQGFTLSWAKELGAFGIRVVGVAPGINEPTPMGNMEHRKALAYTRGMAEKDIVEDYRQKIPLGRPGRLTEIADLVIWLASDKASYITGTTINITGGKSRG